MNAILFKLRVYCAKRKFAKDAKTIERLDFRGTNSSGYDVPIYKSEGKTLQDYMSKKDWERYNKKA
jgi:hypothetical protein